MIYDRFLPARVPSSNGVPEIKNYPWVTGQTFLQGTVVVFNAGEVEEDQSDPTPIVGVSLAPAGVGPGWKAADTPVTSTGVTKNVPIAIANRTTIFSGRLTNGSSATVVPAQADIGAAYGITWYNNIPTVDKANAADRVVIVAIDTINNGVLFKFLEAHLALP